MKAPLHIHRSKVVLGVFIGGSGLFILLWILPYFGIVGSDHITSRLYTLFILGFVIPVFAYFVWLSGKKDPILSISDDRIVLRHIAFPSNTIEIPITHIQEVRTNWEGFSSESCCDVIFKVNEEEFATLKHNKIWRKAEGNELFFEFTAAEINAYKAVDLITKHLRTKTADQAGLGNVASRRA